ncbi:MAG: Hsp20/alpha crystallin family protein [Nitrospinota bacterium]
MSEKKREHLAGLEPHFAPIYVSAKQYSIDEANFIPVDIHETKQDFVIEVEVPGVNFNDLKVSLVENDIVVEGTKQEKLEREGKVNFLCMERSFGPFRRVVRVDHAIDKSRLSATYEDGVLMVRLPKKEERRAKVRIIPIDKEEIKVDE